MLGPHTVEVVNPGTKATDYGNNTEADWSPDAITVTPVRGCSVQPFPVPAYTVDRTSVTTRWIVWMPLGTPVTAQSHVRHGGTEYEVDGDPQVWDFAAAGHIVVNLRRSRDV